MAFAYSPQRWKLRCDSAEGHLERSGSSYTRHFVDTALFSAQLVIAGIAGFTHAFLAFLVPFVAEEVGAEVCLIGQCLQAARSASSDKDGGQDTKFLDGTPPGLVGSTQRQGVPYAFSPQRWIWVVDGQAHVKFSGGSYANHCRFACWASAQWFVGAAAGMIHAVFPMFLPTVHEGVALELGGLIINRRKLRNLLAQEKKLARAAATAKGEALGEDGDNPADEVALINPDNLSDYFSEEFTKRFEKAAMAADRDRDVGDDGTEGANPGLLAQGRVKLQAGPGLEKKFL